MTWERVELEAFAAQDVDDIVGRARMLRPNDRSIAAGDALDRLIVTEEPLDRLKVLLFLQTILAFVPDGTLSRTLSDQSATELSAIVSSDTEPEELRRSALQSLALLQLKAQEISSDASARIHAALTAAQHSPDPEISGFAQRAFAGAGFRKWQSGTSHTPPKILLIHGHDEVNIRRVETFARERWHFTVVTLKDRPAHGRSTIERFEEAAEGAVLALAVFTPDDFRVYLLFKKETELPSDLEGIRRIDFLENVLDRSSELDAALRPAASLAGGWSPDLPA